MNKKPLWLKIVMGIGVGAGTAVTALTAGAVPAILVGVSATAAAIAGVCHPTPSQPSRTAGKPDNREGAASRQD